MHSYAPRRDPRSRHVRLGPVKVAGAGAGLLLLLAFFYGLSVAFWSCILMLVLGACGVHWGYWHAVVPFGLLMPLVLG